MNPMSARPPARGQVLFDALMERRFTQDFQTFLEALLTAGAVPMVVHLAATSGPKGALIGVP
ncbi:hypothetical protein GCM10007235_21070 [Pseudoxanthomonas indica]|nr:hypothetical protein GCM10007235_21070 [Pseudoxanthomonas indica]